MLGADEGHEKAEVVPVGVWCLYVAGKDPTWKDELAVSARKVFGPTRLWEVTQMSRKSQKARSLTR